MEHKKRSLKQHEKLAAHTNSTFQLLVQERNNRKPKQKCLAEVKSLIEIVDKIAHIFNCRQCRSKTQKGNL